LDLLLKKACVESPSNPLFISDWADALQDKKLHKEALACYERVLSIDPDNVQALVKSALVFKNTGDFRRRPLINAAKSPAHKTRRFSGAQRRGPCLHRAWENPYEEATAYFREAVRLNAGFIEAYSNLGNAQSAAGRF
jgi:tetratricopeptide (TPR) repeat protein